MEISKSATNAIRLSQARGQIMHCEDTDDNRRTLENACDDWTDAQDGNEYWQINPQNNDKMIWRVHLA